MVNVRRRDFDLDVIEDRATILPHRPRVADDNPAPRTITFRLPSGHIWRIACNRLFVKVWALVGSARVTVLDENNRECRTVISGDDIWLFDPLLAHRIYAEGGGCVLCLTLVPLVNVDEALSLIRSVEPEMSAV